MFQNQYKSKDEKEKACDALREELMQNFLSESSLKENERNFLSEFLRWSGDPSSLEMTRQSFSELGQLLRDRDYEQRWKLLQSGDEWLNLTYDIHLLNDYAFYTQSNMPVDTYRTAMIYLRRHPTEANAIEQVTLAVEKLFSYLITSGEKLLSRVRDALECGEFEIALQHVHSLESGLFGSIEQEFSGLLMGHEEIAVLQVETEQLKRKISALSTLRTEVYQPLENARRAFLRLFKQLKDSSDVLPTIPDLTTIPYLVEQIQDLWSQVLKEK